MALPARLLLALLLIQVTYLNAAQHDLVTGLSTIPAATIEELMQQMPALFEEEKRLLDQHPTVPAAVTIGDSITAFGYKEDGWVTQLKHDYPEMVFVNKGVPMGNSRSSLIISDWTLGNVQSPLYDKPNRLKLVTLCFGANDASTNRRNSTWRMVPESEYKTNLIDSINIFRAQHVDNVVLITPPPVVVPPRIDRRLDVTDTYANIVKDIGLKLQVPVVDIFTGVQKAVPNWQTAAMLPDGLHLNAVGNKVVHDLVLAAIKDFYPDL